MVLPSTTHLAALILNFANIFVGQALHGPTPHTRQYPTLDPLTVSRITRHTSRRNIMARVYADVNQNMPRSYWDYDSVNISTSKDDMRFECGG